MSTNLLEYFAPLEDPVSIVTNFMRYQIFCFWLSVRFVVVQKAGKLWKISVTPN